MNRGGYMNTPLFYKRKEVSNEAVINRMKHFISEAEHAMEYYQANDSYMLQLARELREELKAEYKTNDLKRTKDYHADHELFESHYKWAIHEAYVAVTGQLNARKAYSFLYDVKDYMQIHLPEDTK